MRKYMVVIKDEDGTSASFFDDYQKAYDTFSIATVSMGYYAELYARGRTDPDDMDEPEGYILIE